MKIHYLFAILLLVTPLKLLAGSGHDHHKDHQEDHSHQQKAHVHGVAELTLAVEGNNLEIAIESPSMNIVGFEHKASTPDQKAAVDKARKQLEQPGQLFAFSGTRCQIKNTVVDMTGVMHTEEKEHDHHHHHEEHGKHKEEGETHSEITASYHFSCDNSADLSSVSVALLNQFSAIETLNASWVTASGQGAQKLTAKSNSIRLK